MRPDGPQLISEMIRKTLNIDCCVMMGANIAGNIAQRRVIALFGLWRRPLWTCPSVLAPSLSPFPVPHPRAAAIWPSAISCRHAPAFPAPACDTHLARRHRRELSESTLGYTDLNNAKLWKKLFASPHFIVQLNPDVAGVSDGVPRLILAHCIS